MSTEGTAAAAFRKWEAATAVVPVYVDARGVREGRRDIAGVTLAVVGYAGGRAAFAAARALFAERHAR